MTLVARLAAELDALAHVERSDGHGVLLARWCLECRADSVRGEPHALTCAVGLLLAEANEAA